MSAFISGIGWVTAGGMGSGRNARSFAMSANRPPAIDRKEAFDQPYRNFGRMDEYSRLGLAAIALALRDAGLEKSGAQRDIGLIAQTDFGCLDTDIDYYQSALPQQGTVASPNLFTYTLPNCFMGEAAIRFGLTGESYIVNETSASALTALVLAIGSIAAGESHTTICGRCDLGRPPLLSAAAEVPAGAVFFVLERDMAAQRHCYGRIDQRPDGRIVFNGETISDLTALTRKCLEVKQQSR